MIALSVTPEYLVQVGLLQRNKVPSADKDVGLLLRQAMDKVAFLPFGLLVDKYRWRVFSGEVGQANLQQGWNDLRLQYQGITRRSRAPSRISIPAQNIMCPPRCPTPATSSPASSSSSSTRRHASRRAGPGRSTAAPSTATRRVGEKLNAMLAMGASKPWPDALEAFTGTREMSGEPMLEYFRPLMGWLEQQNRGRRCGW
jgi:peptidyl-dipeptidase A